MVRTPSNTMPQGSQQSTSGLSDPPDSNDEAFGEITVIINTPTPASPTATISTGAAPGEPDNSINNSDSTMPPKKGKPAAAQPQRKSSRTKRPSRRVLNDSEDELAVEVPVSPTTSKRKGSGKRRSIDDANQDEDEGETNGARAPPAKKPRVIGRTKKWNPDNVTQNEKSPLVNVDLRSLLLQPAAWDCLTAEDKREILALFPANTVVTHILDAGTPDARPNMNALLSDNNFRHDAEQYVTNLSKGMHDPTWLKDAWAAHHRRAAGEFDAYYIRKIEVDWNTTIPDEYKPEHLREKQNGDSASASVPSPEASMKEDVDSGLNGDKNDASRRENSGSNEKEDASSSPKENGTAKDAKETGSNGEGAASETNGAVEATKSDHLQSEETVSSNNGTRKSLSSPIPGQSIIDAARRAQTQYSDRDLGNFTPKSPEERTKPVEGEEGSFNSLESRDISKEAVH